MKTPVFPNSSYLVMVGADPALEKRLRSSCGILGIQPYFSSRASDLQWSLGIMRRVIGVLVFNGSLADDERAKAEQIARSFNRPFRAMALTDDGPDSPTETLTRFVHELTPKSLDQAVTDASNKIFPTMFPGIGAFKPVARPSDGFDYQINFTLTAGDLVGYSSTRLKLAAMTDLLAQDQKSSVLSFLQESINQSLGIVSQQLVQLGINAKIGLPTVFDLARSPEVRPIIYFPSVHIQEEAGRICVNLGFYDLSDAPLFDISGALSTEQSSGDVEFF